VYVVGNIFSFAVADKMVCEVSVDVLFVTEVDFISVQQLE